MWHERVDRVIDEVARELTAGTVSGEFTARVIERIDRRRSPWRLAWVLPPIAAIAIVVAFVVNRPVPPTGESSTSQSPAAKTARLKAPDREAAVPPRPEQTQHPVAQIIIRHPQTPARTNASDIDALAPPPLEVASIALGAIRLDPIATPPMDDVAPITIAPLEPPDSDGSQGRFE